MMIFSVNYGVKARLHKQMKVSVKNLFNKWKQIHGKLWTYSHLPKKYLKKLRNYNETLFLCPSLNQDSKLLFVQYTYTLWHMKLISTCRKINLHLINIIYVVCTSLEIQNRLTLTKVYCKLFYSNWKGATQKPSKVTSAKNFFQCIFYWWMLFIPCDNSKTLHFIVTQRFFSVAIFLLSLKRVFWEKPAFFTFSTITVLY